MSPPRDTTDATWDRVCREAPERLASERAAIEEQLRSVEAELQMANTELSVIDQHSGDNGTDMAERETRVSMVDSLRGRIDEVDAALARLDAGTYGYDEETGEAIDAARLEAVPWARTNVRNARRRHANREAP